jgi:hypothetical protein
MTWFGNEQRGAKFLYSSCKDKGSLIYLRVDFDFMFLSRLLPWRTLSLLCGRGD